MKVKQLIYAQFCDWKEGGVTYSMYDESMREYMDRQGDAKFVCEVEFEDVDREEVVKMGVAAIDKEIADLQVAINRKQDKKQQLLVIGVDK